MKIRYLLFFIVLLLFNVISLSSILVVSTHANENIPSSNVLDAHMQPVTETTSNLSKGEPIMEWGLTLSENGTFEYSGLYIITPLLKNDTIVALAAVNHTDSSYNWEMKYDGPFPKLSEQEASVLAIAYLGEVQNISQGRLVYACDQLYWVFSFDSNNTSPSEFFVRIPNEGETEHVSELVLTKEEMRSELVEYSERDPTAPAGAQPPSSNTQMVGQVPFFWQGNRPWCGVFSLKEVFWYWGMEDVDEFDIANHFGGVPSGLYPCQIEEGFEHWGFQFHWHGDGKSIWNSGTSYASNDLKGNVALGWPTILEIRHDTTGGNGDHFITVVGYNETHVCVLDTGGHVGVRGYDIWLSNNVLELHWNVDSWDWPAWQLPHTHRRAMIVGYPGDQEYAHCTISLSGLPSNVESGQNYKLKLALTEDGSDAGSSRYFWAQGLFLRLYGAELVSASSGGFKSYQAYDATGNSIPVLGAKIIEFYSDFSLRDATIYAYATIKVTGNVIVKYRGWITDEDDMTICVVHTHTVNDDRPNPWTKNNAELVIDRKPNDVQNDRANFLDYPTFRKEASLIGVAPTSISVSVNPSQIFLGGGTTISGQITSSASGDLSGTVYIQYSTDNSNWYNVGSTTSSSSGAYSYFWEPSSTGTYYVRSYWNGNAQFGGATSSSVTLTVNSPGGNLADHTMCKGVQSYDPWDPITRTNTFYTDDFAAYSWLKFTDIYSPSHTVHWNWYDPDGQFITSASYTIPDPGAGYYYPWYKVWCGLYINGYQAWYASRLGRPFQTKVYYDNNLVVTETWQVIKHGSSITISLSSSSTTFGQSVTISSWLSPSFSDGTTTLQYSGDGVNWNNLASGTPSNGYYSYNWIPPSTGTYYFRATWSGNLNYYGSTSSQKTLTVSRASTSLTTYLSSATITYGASVSITASMSPQLQGKTVTIQYSLDGSTWYYLSSGTTSSIGQYSYSWTPSPGIYYLRSTWSGDANYYGSTSTSQQLTVNKISTSTEIVSGENALIDRFSGGLHQEAVTLGVRVKNIVSDTYLSSTGIVEFYVDGNLIGSDNDADGNQLYELSWNPPDSWLKLGSQIWEARFVGTPEFDSSEFSSTLTVHGQLYNTLLEPNGETFRPGDIIEIAVQVTSDSPLEGNIKGCAVTATLTTLPPISIPLTDPDNDGIYTAKFMIPWTLPPGPVEGEIRSTKPNYHDGKLGPIVPFTIETEIHKVDVSINPAIATVQSGTSFTYEVIIHNTGNTKDTFDLTLVGLDASWYVFALDSVTLDPDQAILVPLTVSPPADLASSDLGDYPFTTKATCQADPSTFDTADAVITVIAPILVVTADSPVNILVTAPNGDKVGYDPTTGTTINEIPGATYTGPDSEPQEIQIPNPLEGNYEIDIFGTDTGTYTITMKSLASDGSTIDTVTWTGTTELGQHDTQKVDLADGIITDATGPTTTDTTVTPTPTIVNPTLTATVTDALSTVVTAEYFIDTTGADGTGIPLSVIDGAFDELTEEVTAIISISALIQGEHTVYVHGKDSANNWGDFDSFTFVVVKTYLLTVEASPLDASGGTLLATYTLNQVTYIDEEQTTPWTTEADVGTTITISSPQQIIDKIPDDGMRYAYASGAGTFTMDSDKTITLVYKTQYYLTMSTNFGTVSPGSAWFDAATTLTIEATAPSVIEGERYVWLGWTGIDDISYSGMDNPATDAVVMNSPVSETASWRHEFRLTITTNFGTTDPTTGDHWYEAGAIVTISATSPSTVEGERYVWNRWTGTGDIAYTGADNPASITLNSPITETASWTHEYYLATSTNFGSASPTSNWFEAGSVIEISATPPSILTGEQYVWNGWSGTGSGSYSGLDNPSSVTMNAPITEIASWTHQFYLEIEVVNEIGADISSVVKITGQGWYDADTEVDLTAPQDVEFAIDYRYDFRSWAGDVSDTTNTISVIMTAPRTVTAHYMTQYYLTVNNGGHGTASGEGWYDSGVSATFSISPTIVYDGDETRYVFTQWSGDSTSTSPSDTILMDGPKTVTANWKTQYKVTFEQTGSGATTYVTYIADTDPTEAVPFSIWTKADSTLTFSYYEMVNDGQPTRYVLVNVDHTSPLTVNGPITITATYKTQHYLTVEHSTADSILDGHQTGQDYYDADSVATVTADLHVDIITGESRYEFDHWSGDASGAIITATIIMSAPKTAIANYKTQYYITVISAHDSPTPSVWVNAGSDFTASVTSPTEIVPNDQQWVCTGYSVDGGAYQAGTSHTFTNVQAAHSIDFAWKQQFWIQVDSTHDSPTPSQWIDQGDSPTVSVTSPADDDGMGTRYRCTGYTLNSNPPVTDGSTNYNFEDVQEAHTITFNWITQYRLTVTSDHDSPDPAVGDHWYDSGTSISASVSSPADDDGMGTRYRCAGWTLTKDLITTSGSEISFSFSMDSPSTLTWNWIAQYYLTMATNFGEVSPLSDWYDAGTELNILATSPDVIPNERYVWNGWSGTGIGSYSGPDNPALIMMNSPISESASWTHQYYIIVISAHDTPTPSDWVDQGGDFTASVTSPAEIVPSDHQWVCTGFNVDEESAQPGTSYTFTNVQAPHTITFNWKKQFWIQVNSDHDNPTPSDWVDQGDSFTASVISPADIEPEHHQWVCSGFSVDGGALQPGTSYTFIDVQAPHTIVFSWWEQFWVTLTYTGDTTGQYSDPASVSATLTVTETGQPLQGKTITFTIGTQSATAITNETGIAATTITLTQPASTPGVTVKFAGDTIYLPRTIEEPFIIDYEDAAVDYTGDTVVPTTAKSINLRATVFDSPDGCWGDLTEIQVTFSIYAGQLSSTPFMTIPAVPVSQTDMSGVGVAVATIDILQENGYLIIVSIDGNDYYEGPTSDATPLTVYEPTGDFVTGGGWIWDPSGSKGNFGFNAKYTKSGRPQGHSIYVYRENGWDYIVKSNAWIGLAIDGTHAYFEAKCVVQMYNPATGELLWAEGNYKFRVDVWDNDSDGGVDIYQIRVLDKNGVVYHEAGFDPLGELQGGNIVIHDERKKKP